MGTSQSLVLSEGFTPLWTLGLSRGFPAMVLWNFSKSIVAALSFILSLLPSSFECELFELVEVERVRYLYFAWYVWRSEQ